MRVAIVTESWRPSVDGVVTRLDNTVRQLQRAGHEVMVVGPSVDPTVEVEQRKTATISLDFLYGGQAWALPSRAVGRALQEFRPDVVHVVNPVCMGLAAVRTSVRRRFPTVVSYHTDVSAYASLYHLGRLRWAIHATMRRVYRRADARLATSEVGRAQLETLGIDDVQLWARGVDTSLFHPGRDGSEARKRLCPDPGCAMVLYVGRLAREKGCDRLLSLAAGPGPFHVTFVGDGPDRHRLEGLFAGTRASFAGVLRGDDLADAYAAADVFVFPSQTDTLGLVLLEAMASGLPVVATDSPAARTVLAEYASTRLVPPSTGSGALAGAVCDLVGRPDLVAGARQLGDAIDAGATVGAATSPSPTGRWADARRPVTPADAAEPPGRSEADRTEWSERAERAEWSERAERAEEPVGPSAAITNGNRSGATPLGPRRLGAIPDLSWERATADLVGHYHEAIRCRRPSPPEQAKRIRRFALVGLSNAIVDLVAFNILVVAHPTRSSGLLVAYNTLAVLAALLNSWLWNSRWTFGDRAAPAGTSRWRQRLLFVVQGAINLGVSDATILGLSEILSPHLGVPAAVTSNASKVVAMFVASAVSFLLMHFIVFRHRGHPAAELLDPTAAAAELAGLVDGGEAPPPPAA